MDAIPVAEMINSRDFIRMGYAPATGCAGDLQRNSFKATGKRICSLPIQHTLEA